MLQIESGNDVAIPRNERCQYCNKIFFDGQAFNC